MKELHNRSTGAIALKAQTIATDTTTPGETLDMQGYQSCLFLPFTGTLTDGDYEFQLFEGDESDMSDEAEVSSDDVVGTIPDWDADADDDKISQFAYIGTKRYVRVKVVSTNTTTGAVVGAMAVQSHALDNPPTQADGS